MKLASLKQGRDGRLVVVSSDLAWYADAGHIVGTLQAALDDWDQYEGALRNLATDLDHEVIPRERFHEREAAAPLPRAYQWADGSAYVNHVALVRQARNAEMPETFWHDPLMYQGGSDGFLGPRDPIPLADESWGCDLEAEVVVVTGDVPLGASREEALAAVRLVGLTNDVSLRNLIPGELAKGFGFFQSKPASAFSPVFVTPDALGDWWQDGKLHRKLMVDLNGQPFGRAEAGEDMTFDFGTLIAHAAKTRALGAGTIIGSGTVSNRDADGGPGKPIAQGGVGYSCLAEVRTVETIVTGKAETPFLKAGDTVRIWAEDDKHHPIFGVIEQTVGDKPAMCNEQARRVALGLLRDDINDLRIPVHFPEGLPNLEPTDSIRITDRNVILRASPLGGAELVVRRWSWPGTHGKPVYNLRSDGRRFDRGRCLIVADAFFEFSDPAPDADGRRPRRKRKWRFEKRGEPWFAIAGIWRTHPEVGEAYTMLTIPPGTDVAPYHDRQVAVIERRDFEEWLDPDARPEHLLQPPPPGSFDVSEVIAPAGP